MAIDHGRSFSLGNPLTVDIKSPFVHAQHDIPFELLRAAGSGRI
ncbi:hypothetical protein [Nocardia paucivorans]|nr:hypothetical protein [Nocardia paucivorans]